jgi:hypothetical protein
MHRALLRVARDPPFVVEALVLRLMRFGAGEDYTPSSGVRVARRFSRRHLFRRSSSPKTSQPWHFERLEGRVVLASAVAGVGTGLIANYFSDQELQNLALTRVDPAVDFDWQQGSPGAAVPADNFSARWVGKIQAQYNETYTFYTQSDEGVALWVNNQQIIDNFSDHTFGEDAGTITLKAGELYDIRVEY